MNHMQRNRALQAPYRRSLLNSAPSLMNRS